MNKTELKAMGDCDAQVQYAFLQALAKQNGHTPISSIGTMIQFPATCEHAIQELDKRAAQFPVPVATQLVFKMHGNQKAWDMALHVLRKIPADALKQAYKAVQGMYNAEDPRRWERHVRKVKQALKGR